ncbi:hypothetical protein F5Y04DRAFT_274005 [Hypomontagnella monticulosa]|nr:hypothetical protein F5Y04DRAFT_274005 [Hypomontagnella monticulosa]
MEYQPVPTPSYPAPASAPPSGPAPSSLPVPPEPRLERPITTPFAGTDIRSIKTACEFSLSEYLTLSRRRYDDPSGQHRLRQQQGIVLSDLQLLRSEISDLVKSSESHRWRKWLLGGLMASFIPAVRRIFRRSSKDTESNDTEYAFKRSKSLISRILDSVHGKGRLASLAFFVLAVLYVFQSEVTLRVGRTMSKRLKKLMGKVERGDQGLGEEDIKVLNGWRWRVLLW